MEKEKEKAIIELLNQKKPYSEIEQKLHVSSRDISITKKKYEEQQNEIQSQSEVHPEVVPSDLLVAEQHNDQIQVLRDEIKRACVKRRSGIIAMKTESLYDKVRFLLTRDAEYCYLIYEDNKLKWLVDALKYEEDLTKKIESAKEQPIEETINKLQVQNDGSIY
jgi:hypothetical protein